MTGRSLPEKLIAAQLLKTYPAFYGTRRYKSTMRPYPEQIINPAHTLPVYFFNVYLNILPSAPRSSKWSFLARFIDRKFACVISPVFR
jgi:hypothetical protein